MHQPTLGPSPFVHILTQLTGLCFAALGAVLFLAPAWSAAHFPWEQYPFVVMTMGGWYLGGALFAWEAARRRRWELTSACHRYLWSFALVQVAVLVAFHGALDLDAVLAWPYLLTLALGLLTALAGMREAACVRRAPRVAVRPAPWWLRGLTVGFSLFVGFLALMLLTGLARGALIWGEPLEPITAHAFGGFYLALVVATLPLSWAPSRGSFRAILRAGLAMSVLLFGAAIANLGVFDLQARPTGLLYLASYLIVAGASVAILRALRPGPHRDSDKVLAPA